MKTSTTTNSRAKRATAIPKENKYILAILTVLTIVAVVLQLCGLTK